MGSYVSFIGFNRPPDIQKLKELKWLESWRLFQERETNAWFLEGQSETETITFFEEVKASTPVLSHMQAALLEQIKREIERHGSHRDTLVPDTTELALLLSVELEQPVAAFMGDDLGADSALIFDCGALVSGRVEIDWNKALAFNADANAQLEWLYPEGVSEEDPDFKVTRVIYQILLEEAQGFFGDSSLRETLDSPRDDVEKFELKAEHGTADPPYRSKSDVLRDDLGRSPSPKQLIERIEPIINTILDPNFPNASNEDRFAMDDWIGGCVVYVDSLRFSSSPHLEFYADLKKVLAEISKYTMRLRPKPDFRKKSINFGRWNRELSGKWDKQKRRAEGKGFWFFR